jgi:hypothetical protein
VDSDRLPAPWGLYRQEYGEAVDLRGTKGSPYRGFRNIVGTAASASTTIPFGTSVTITIPVREESVISHLVISSNVVACAVSAFLHNGDPLTTGNVPTQMFDAQSDSNPYIGHWTRVSDAWSITIRNDDAATNANVQVSLVTALGDPRRSSGGWIGSHVRPRLQEAGSYRSLIAIGSDNVGANVAGGGGQVTYTMSLLEGGFLGYLVLGNGQPGLAITSIELMNNRLVSGFVPSTLFSPIARLNPVFGQYVEPGMSLQVFGQNDGAGAVKCHAGFACM